jgi:tetratricopeptide (TPR) repeat protein
MIRALPAFAGIASFLVLSGVSLGIYSMKGGQVWEPSSPAPHHESVNTAPEGSFRPWRPYNQETSPEREPPVSPVHAPSVPYTGGFARSDHSGSPAVESNRAASDAHIKRGRASYRAGATGEAIAAFRMATASDPSNAQAHMWLSNAFIRDSQFVEAEAEARSGLSLADSAEQQGAALHNICRALEGQGRLDEALRSCERSLSVRPDNLDTNNTIDRIRARQPGAPPATSGEESTVTDCRVHIERGIEANRAEDREAAITAFQQAVECSEENPGAHLFLSNALIVAERYSEGADAARRALTLAESSEQRGAAYNNLCRAMEGMDRIDEAIWNCERSLRVRPGNEAVQRRLERLREGLR